MSDDGLTLLEEGQIPSPQARRELRRRLHGPFLPLNTMPRKPLVY